MDLAAFTSIVTQAFAEAAQRVQPAGKTVGRSNGMSDEVSTYINSGELLSEQRRVEAVQNLAVLRR